MTIDHSFRFKFRTDAAISTGSFENLLAALAVAGFELFYDDIPLASWVEDFDPRSCFVGEGDSPCKYSVCGAATLLATLVVTTAAWREASISSGDLVPSGTNGAVIANWDLVEAFVDVRISAADDDEAQRMIIDRAPDASGNFFTFEQV